MSRIGLNRLARTNVLCAADVTNITVTTPNSEIIANLVKETKDVIVEQFFRAFTASDVVNDTHTTITQTNVQGNVEHYTYENGYNNSEVELFKIVNGDHYWFNLNYNDLTLEEIMWDFFSKHSKD